MTHDFWKAVTRGLFIGTVLSLVFLVAFKFYTMGDPTVKVQLKMLITIGIMLFCGTGFAYSKYQHAYHVSRLRNLDRVHPLAGGRRRTFR